MGDLRLQFVFDNITNFSHICDIREQHNTRLFCNASWTTINGSSRNRAKTEDYFKLELQELFTVPESQNRIKKHQFVEAFLSFLHHSLYQRLHSATFEDLVYSATFPDQTGKLQKELRFLLTILGDTPLLLCDDDCEGFQLKLWAEFEAVANEAGSLLYPVLFPTTAGDLEEKGFDFFFNPLLFPTTARELEEKGFDFFFNQIDLLKAKMDFFFNHIDLLKAKMMEFLNLVPFTSRSAYATRKISVLDSLLIVDSLVHDLKDLMNREDSPIADVKDHIKALHQGLVFAQSSIKYIGWPQPSEIEELREPLMRIGDMAHRAEYLIISFLVGDAPPWYLVARLTDINKRIELIANDELREIAEKYKSGGLEVAKYFSTQLLLQAKGNAEVDDVTVGFEENTTDVLYQLVEGTESMQVISIFGMPGIGKTTFAKKLYNRCSDIKRFDKLSWCVISQTYLRQSILADILIQIASELEKDKILKMEEERLVEHIYKTLKRRRYLVVMDDLWDSSVWDDLRRCFPDDGNGSRILFTTRNKDVAPPNSIIYAQPSLSNDQCWELLEKKVFHDEPCPQELIRIGKKIAANCNGLPLVVVVIAGILSTMERKRSTWKKVERNLASYIFEGGDSSSVMQLLELSYKHLPDRLKPCFLYFGAFEEDKEIPARHLMRLWIAEGFVYKEERKTAENVAEEYLMELIDKSLVMVAKRKSDGGVKACVIHDLLHDLCSKICEEEKFLKFEQGSVGPEGRLAFASGSYCQHIRSFRGSSLTPILYVRDMKLLRILDSSYRFDNLIGIEDLVNLRHLVVDVRVLEAPIFSRLLNLEYLRVDTNEAVYITPVIVGLKKLRYLEVQSCNARYDAYGDSSQTNNLEFLSGVRIWETKGEEKLKSSPRLRHLKCKCDHLSSRFDLGFLTHLESLKLDLYSCRFKEICLPSNIKKLNLTRGFFSKLPSDIMSMIGRLKKLESLKLNGILFFREETLWETRDDEFQELRFLKLRRTNLCRWNVVTNQHFPKLQRLVLIHCFSLEEIPGEIGEIATLELIEVQGKCLKSLVESVKRIQQEQLDMGNEELRVITSNVEFLNESFSEDVLSFYVQSYTYNV